MSSTLTSLALLHERFESQAEARPRARAVECDGIRLSYRELNQEANRLAKRLAEVGVKQDKLVVIEAQRSCDLIVAILAVLKAGGAFVLAEDARPGSSRDAWLRSTGAQVVLTDFPGGFEARGMQTVGVYEASGSDENLPVRTHAEGWACVADHFGWTHTDVAKRLDWARDVLGLVAGERVLSSVPLEGEAVLELLLPLLSGATLVLASEWELHDPRTMEELAKRADCRTLKMPRRLAATA
jgi:syringomycin synthetase protein SyrE